MALEKMSMMIDSKLKHEFESYVLDTYSNLEEGILNLIKIYVQKQKSAPTQEQIKQRVKTVFQGDPGCFLNSREIEKIVLNKTDEEIEANRLA